MGTWGTRIYEDDTALDVRSDFLDYLKTGMTVDRIEQKIIDESAEVFDPSEDYWNDTVRLAICCVELETGTLTEETKDAALKIIESGRQHQHWLDEAGAQDAGKRSRELTLVRKYIDNYDGKPVKRKSWTELQKADEEYQDSVGPDEKESNDKLDDIGWHAADIHKDLDEEEYIACAGAHIACFDYWLITRGYFNFRDDMAKADAAKVKGDSSLIFNFISTHQDMKLWDTDAIATVRPFVKAYYFGIGESPSYVADYENMIPGDREMFSFRPTKKDLHEMADTIDVRYSEYKRHPFEVTSKAVLDRSLHHVVWISKFWVAYYVVASISWITAILVTQMPPIGGGEPVSLAQLSFSSGNPAWGLALWIPFTIGSLANWISGKKSLLAEQIAVAAYFVTGLVYLYGLLFVFDGLIGPNATLIDWVVAVIHAAFFLGFSLVGMLLLRRTVSSLK